MDQKKAKSPWLAIWVRPKQTIQKIVKENPRKHLWFLATIYGFSTVLGSFQSFSLGAKTGIIALFFIALILAPIVGYIHFSVWSWIVLWIGKWFKGRGNFQTVRAAYTWSCVPYIVTDAIWILMMIIFGGLLFLNPPVIYPTLVMLFMFFALAKVVLSVWSIVIYINTLSTVQGFSILRAIGNILVAIVFVAIVIWILWEIFLYFSGNHYGSGNMSTAFQILQDCKLLYITQM